MRSRSKCRKPRADLLKRQLTPNPGRDDLSQSVVQTQHRCQHFVGDQPLRGIVVDVFLRRRTSFARLSPATRQTLVLCKVACRAIEPSNDLLRRSVQDRQSAEHLLDDVFRARASPANPDLQRNRVPFDQRGNLVGGKRHRGLKCGVAIHKQDRAGAELLQTFFRKTSDQPNLRLASGHELAKCDLEVAQLLWSYGTIDTTGSDGDGNCERRCERFMFRSS